MNALVVCPSCEKINRIPFAKAETARPVCGACKADLPFHGGVQDVSGSALLKLVRAADRPVVVDCWAEWCGPCKAFAPTFQAAARELGDRFLFVKLDTETHSLAAQTYGIRSIPTLIVFDKGVEVARQSGAMPLPMFTEFLNRLG